MFASFSRCFTHKMDLQSRLSASRMLRTWWFRLPSFVLPACSTRNTSRSLFAVSSQYCSSRHRTVISAAPSVSTVLLLLPSARLSSHLVDPATFHLFSVSSLTRRVRVVAAAGVEVGALKWAVWVREVEICNEGKKRQSRGGEGGNSGKEKKKDGQRSFLRTTPDG